MKQKGNQNEAIFSFVCLHVLTHMFNTFHWHMQKKNLKTVFCVKRHTYAMNVCVLCGIYAGTGIEMCRIFSKGQNVYSKIECEI